MAAVMMALDPANPKCVYAIDLDADPTPLLFHARERGDEPLQDTPESRRRGWWRYWRENGRCRWCRSRGIP